MVNLNGIHVQTGFVGAREVLNLCNSADFPPLRHRPTDRPTNRPRQTSKQTKMHASEQTKKQTITHPPTRVSTYIYTQQHI